MHGGVSHAEIECEGPDTGELVLPGEWLDLMAEEGWDFGNCGSNNLARQYTAVQGDVRFDARAEIWFPNPTSM